MKLFELLPCVDLPGQRSLTVAPPIDLMVKQALARLERRPSRQWLDSVRDLETLVSAPVKKSSNSASVMSSGPIGGDAVKNSIVVSKCFAILAFSYFRCERQSLLRSCPWGELSEALAMRGSLGLTYRDHLADPVANHHGVNIATKVGDVSLPLFQFPLTAREANLLA